VIGYGSDFVIDSQYVLNSQVHYGQQDLPESVRSRIVSVGELEFHVLEAGWQGQDRPLVLLLHGFPEIAYSWRHQLPALAEAGFHVVAPDQRGYGLTTGWSGGYDADLSPFRLFNLARDVVRLVGALGRVEASGIVGHDFGSPVAAWASLIRPDIFRRVVLMSAPFGGTPALVKSRAPSRPSLHDDLADLDPPRKHYQTYYSEKQAGEDMMNPPQGLHRFLREYYFLKSADYAENRPRPLEDASAVSLAALPRYYVMESGATMPETTASLCEGEQVVEPAWLSDESLDVYVNAYRRSGFQGGLNWYRGVTSPVYTSDLGMFAGRTIDVPALFIAGKADWGIYQSPGQFERMQSNACRDFRGARLIDNAGHWVQQEQADEVNRLLLEFLAG